MPVLNCIKVKHIREVKYPFKHRQTESGTRCVKEACSLDSHLQRIKEVYTFSQKKGNCIGPWLQTTNTRIGGYCLYILKTIREYLGTIYIRGTVFNHSLLCYKERIPTFFLVCGENRMDISVYILRIGTNAEFREFYSLNFNIGGTITR